MITTRDRLRNWGLSVPPECLLCNTATESKSHLFFECSYFSVVWNTFFTHHTLSPHVLLIDIVRWVRSASRHGKLTMICKLMLQTVIYYLWREKNARLHTAISKPAQLLVKDINVLLRAKLIGLDRFEDSVSQRSLMSTITSTDSLTYFSFWFGFIQI